MPPRSGARRLHGSIAHDLGVAILSGRHLPGDLLEGEISASGKLRVSRSAYREAVRMLAAKGLVECRPKTGTRITPRSRWNLLDPDVLAWQFEGEPDRTLLRGLFELRMIVEPDAAALAAERRQDGHLQIMQAAIAEMERYGLEREEGRLADRRFHDALLDATGNEHIAVLTSSFGASVRWTTVFKLRSSERLRDSIPDHRRVYEAIRDRAPAGAREAMAELVRLAADDVGIAIATPDQRRREAS